MCVTFCSRTPVQGQATTTAQHTLRLDTFDGEAYEGALLYVTLSVNNFAFQSIEEVDPVDWWALLGSAGGMWGKDAERMALDSKNRTVVLESQARGFTRRQGRRPWNSRPPFSIPTSSLRPPLARSGSTSEQRQRRKVNLLHHVDVFNSCATSDEIELRQILLSFGIFFGRSIRVCAPACGTKMSWCTHWLGC